MPLHTCPACMGAGWVRGPLQPAAMCETCAGVGKLLAPSGRDRGRSYPRFSPMRVRRWRRGQQDENGDWEWLVVRDYSDASICYLADDHELLPGWQVELAAYDPDPASDLYSEDVRPRLARDGEGYLCEDGRRALVLERAVLQWHRSFGCGHERYLVIVAAPDLDGEMLTAVEIWDMQHHELPFPSAESKQPDEAV